MTATIKGPNKTAKGDGTAPYQRKADGMWCMAIELPSPDGRRRRRKVFTGKTPEVVRIRRDNYLRKLAGDTLIPTSVKEVLAMKADAWGEGHEATPDAPNPYLPLP